MTEVDVDALLDEMRERQMEEEADDSLEFSEWVDARRSDLEADFLAECEDEFFEFCAKKYRREKMEVR